MNEQLVMFLLKQFGPWLTLFIIVGFAYFKLRAGNLIVLQNGSKKNGKKTPKEAETTLCTYRLDLVEKRLDDGDKIFEKHGDALGRIDRNVATLLERTK